MNANPLLSHSVIDFLLCGFLDASGACSERQKEGRRRALADARSLGAEGRVSGGDGQQGLLLSLWRQSARGLGSIQLRVLTVLILDASSQSWGWVRGLWLGLQER